MSRGTCESDGCDRDATNVRHHPKPNGTVTKAYCDIHDPEQDGEPITDHRQRSWGTVIDW